MATKIKTPKRYYKTQSGTYRARITRNGITLSKNLPTLKAIKAWLEMNGVGKRNHGGKM